MRFSRSRGDRVPRRTGRVGFVNDFCSDSIFSLVRTAFCNRVEHTTAFPAARPEDKGTHKGRPYGDRARRRGRVDKRPDPFPSTTLLFYLWQRPDPREPGTAHPGLCFSRLRGRLGSQRRTVRVVVVNNFYSGSVFSLVRRAFCNRVEHTTAFPAARPEDKGTHKGRSYGDRARRRGRVDMRADPFPSTTLWMHLWQRAEPKAADRAPLGCGFSRLTGADGFLKAGGQSRCRQQPLFWFSFFSGEEGVLQQGRTYNRVPGRASGAQGYPQGVLLWGQSAATGQDRHAARSVSINNSPLLPLETA